MTVVASNEDADKIVGIMCQWLPATYAYDMMEEIWMEVGRYTDNDSLHETIQILMQKIYEADNIIYPEGFE